ncbi:hypothetical protein [Herbidospora cretacea]|uniref:hypothetical protein n=1 Tax=Herbidospora cretacea TaxID=28444 RepID=UPI00077359C0|nr:hypothetical protein [Herbidospora cretacea]
MHPDLVAALDQVAVTFRGATARPDESNCECHWGSAEELALLKVPDVELDHDLLQRTWRAGDWDDPGAVLRRILPQFTVALVHGRVEPWFGMGQAGRCLDRGDWHERPAEEGAAVGDFLRVWWACTLGDPDPGMPAHDVLTVCVEASGTLSPWLQVWERQTHDVADRHLAEAVASWEYALLGDQLPWESWDDEEDKRVELTAWVLRHAPARLRRAGASGELLDRVRLLGLPDPARYEDPRWPGHRY